MVTGTEFRKARKKAKMTLAEAGRRAGIADITVCKFEKGKNVPRPENHKKLQKVFETLTVKHEAKAPEGSPRVPSNLFVLVEDPGILDGLLSKMNSTEVAEIVGCTQKTVDLWIKEHGLSKPDATRTKLTAAALSKRPFFKD